MAAGGKPLWYIQIFTTVATFILTVFYMSVCLNWSGGLDGMQRPPKYPVDEWEILIETGIKPFKATLQGPLLWFNLGSGLLTTLGGAAFGYLLFRQRIRLFYSWIWFGLVGSFTIVWMVTSIIFYVDTEEIARQKIHEEHLQMLPTTLGTVYKWGKGKSAATVIGLIVFPTFLYIFLTFVAYRLYVKLEMFGNEDPERLSRDFRPGSWVERKQAADGGTWDREETAPLVTPPAELNTAPDSANDGLRQRRTPPPVQNSNAQPLEEVQEGVLVGGTKRTDSMTGGWGAWLEDVFDYSF